MSSRFRSHIRSNVVGYVALFVALSGVAYGATHLAKNSVGSKQIKKNSVTTAKIKDSAVTNSKLSDGAVTSPKLAPNSVTGVAVADGSLTAADIQTSMLPHDFRSFDAVLAPNQAEAVTIGNLTFTETADGAGACTSINLTTGSKTAKIGLAGGSVINEVPNSTIGLTGMTGGSADDVLANSDGTDNVVATLAATPVSGRCLTFGGIAPIQ